MSFRSVSRTPTVPVVMPAHNARRLIDAAIRSIRDQTLADWELIVVNDGSSTN
jgi:glycosyltransferase involved in cell wall biosynthesis